MHRPIRTIVEIINIGACWVQATNTLQFVVALSDTSICLRSKELDILNASFAPQALASLLLSMSIGPSQLHTRTRQPFIFMKLIVSGFPLYLK